MEKKSIKRFFIMLAVSFVLCTTSRILAANLPGTLSPEEQTFLETLRGKTITYLIPPRFIPISYVENGTPNGIVKEYLHILQNKLDLKLSLADVSWKQGMEMARKGEIDFFPCLSWSKEREAFISFTPTPYISFSLVIVSQKDGRAVRKIENLDGKRLAVDRDLVAYSRLVNDYSHLNIDFIFRKNVVNVLKAVHLGEADACISSSANAGYLISKNGWSNLKISGETGWKSTFLRMGTRKDWPLFSSIIEKTLAGIPESTHNEITKKWIPVQFEHSFDSRYVLKRILPFLGGIVAITLLVCLFLVIVLKKNKQLQQAEAALLEASRAKSLFLDNSGQGFLSFGPDLRVEKEYSLECRRIFGGGDIEGVPVQTLLCPGDAENQALLVKNFHRILDEPDDFRRSLYLSLMQTEFHPGDKSVEAAYKLIHGSKIMLILTDVTRRKQLENEIRKERNLLRFVVSTVRESRDFFDILHDFKRFWQKGFPVLLKRRDAPQETLDELYRILHTFKGLFAQQDFIHIPDVLHQMESALSRVRQDPGACVPRLGPMVERFGPESALEKDLEIIRDFLGDSFLSQKKEIVLTRDRADRITDMARRISNRTRGDGVPEIAGILHELETIRYVNLKTLLASHCRGAVKLARRLEKTISEVEVQGDDILVSPDRCAPFIKSLIHVFRNAIAHGIESPDERLNAGKNESGTLSCRVEAQGSNAVITIADDGRGIAVQKVKDTALERGLTTTDELAKMDEGRVIQMIFNMNLSTGETISNLSGRGVGLSSVKAELDRLNGRVEIVTRPNEGTCFRFFFPHKGMASG